MTKHTLTYPPSRAARTVIETGPGRVLRVTLAHDQPSPQVVYFYDRLGQLIKEFKMSPFGRQYTLSFANRHSFSFDDGLKVLTGNCEVTVVLLHEPLKSPPACSPNS